MVVYVEKIDIFVSEPEPNVSEQFYAHLEKAKWENKLHFKLPDN